MSHALPLRSTALGEGTGGQKKVAAGKVGAENWDNDFATKFYHQAHNFVNAWGSTQMDTLRLQGNENSQCLVAPPWDTLFDSALHSLDEAGV